MDDAAAPYELRPLPLVPVLEDRKLELRVLCRLFGLEVDRGMEGVGTASRDDDCEPTSSEGNTVECPGEKNGAVCGRFSESSVGVLESKDSKISRWLLILSCSSSKSVAMIDAAADAGSGCSGGDGGRGGSCGSCGSEVGDVSADAVVSVAVVVGAAAVSFVDWKAVVVVAAAVGGTSSADTDTSNLRFSSIVPKLAAVAGRPSLSASS